jgi:hypothetical protein
MYTHVSKCKNEKIKLQKEERKKHAAVREEGAQQLPANCLGSLLFPLLGKP